MNERIVEEEERVKRKEEMEVEEAEWMEAEGKSVRKALLDGLAG